MPTKPTPPPPPTEDDSVEALQQRAAARKEAPGLSPKEINDLQQTYRDVALASDDDGKSIKRAVEAKLRRLSHAELHPECGTHGKVVFDVPQHPSGAFYTINEKPYVGPQTVWPCEARQLAYMIELARQVERDRMKESGRTMDLDNPVAERIRQIQEA